ncbi:Uu.00g120510.m01.CDS01 [Anthostomella pinea]|uniref:Uu.00g120510.m01.CDS01 n=1 Tax=Anthostomella pinea TaxID=933095 RepID=A0AAI8VBK6_9PEZI|nr:Uu.00g120510.m01.CDS01 [Anthostomella pinea]
MATDAGPSKPPAIPPLDIPKSDATSRPRANSKAKPASAADPVLRNALRYTISAREYETLHKYVLSRSRLLRKRAPSVNAVEKYMDGGNARRGSIAERDLDRGKGKGKEKAVSAGMSRRRGDGYNARAIRHALRVFVATGLGAKAYGVILARIKGQQETGISQKKQPLYKSSTLRLSLSLSTILLLYRLLFRFLTRLRIHLLDSSAAPFRTRNPRTSNTLTSPYAPAIGASLAGLALGIYPSAQLRVTVTIALMFRALEWGWNLFEDEGLIWGWKTRASGKGVIKRERPWWWGSWMLQPFACGQLLHATLFDRESSPAGFVNFIWKNTSTYLHSPPKNLPVGVKWPGAWEVADDLAQTAKLNWPSFVSPTLFPNQPTLPASLTAVAPLTSQAHPLITSLSCAILHPSDPSCLRTYLSFWVRSFPRMGRFFLLFYTILALPRYKMLYNSPIYLLNKLLSKTFRISTFATGAISTAWASICLFQNWLPRTFLPTQRFFLGGFLAGLWAFVERKDGRSIFLYSARTSVDSLWKVGVKRRWWRAMKGGDVWLFVVALAVTGAVYERDARAIRENQWRKGISWVRGTDFRDWGVDEDEEEDMHAKEE